MLQHATVRQSINRKMLPGGDFGSAGVTGFEAELRGEHGWPPERQAHRYVRTYGTRAREILTGMRGLGDLGRCLGADL